MEKFLVTYDNEKVITVSQWLGEAVVLSTSRYLIDTLDNAEAMLAAIGIDTGEIEHYKNLNGL